MGVSTPFEEAPKVTPMWSICIRPLYTCVETPTLQDVMKTPPGLTIPTRVEWLEARIAPAAAVLDLSTLDGTTGFAVHGAAAGDMLGASASGIGDINGDTVPDFAIGVPYAETATTARDSGQVAVVFGRTSGLPSNLRIDQLDGTNGFV